MQDLKDSIVELSDRFNEVKNGVNIPEKKDRVHLLEASSTSPEFWDNKDTARDQLQELADLNKSIEEIVKIEESIKTVEELLNDLNS